MPSSETLPAPAPADTITVIGVEQAGRTIAVPVGKRFSVALRGIPTAGYVWTPAPPPAFLSLDEQGGGATSTAQLQPGFTGGSHWEVFTFTAREPGQGKLEFAQRRPWETGEPPADTFAVTILAR